MRTLAETIEFFERAHTKITQCGEDASYCERALEALKAQKVGKWHRFEDIAKCSECGEITKIGDTHRNKYTGRVSQRDFEFKYCPKCGAKMESEESNETN